MNVMCGGRFGRMDATDSMEMTMGIWSESRRVCVAHSVSRARWALMVMSGEVGLLFVFGWCVCLAKVEMGLSQGLRDHCPWRQQQRRCVSATHRDIL